MKIKTTLEELKKGDVFEFENEIFTVTRKYIDYYKPLIATSNGENHYFGILDLLIYLISNPKTK